MLPSERDASGHFGADHMLTVDDIAKRYGVKEHTVLGWIHSGELKAVNVGRALDRKRPRWRISPAALEAFEAARSATPAPPKASRRRRDPEVIQFYS